MGPVTVLILPQPFLLMAKLNSSKLEEIMIFGVIVRQTVARGGEERYSEIFIHT